MPQGSFEPQPSEVQGLIETILNLIIELLTWLLDYLGIETETGTES